MPKEWVRSLEGYRYKVVMHHHINADQYPGFFEFHMSSGDRYDTQLFENYFREFSKTKIEVWIEVVFWKMYSQKGRRDNKTIQVAEHFKKQNISPNMLFEACNKYIKEDSKSNLDDIRQLLGFRSTAIAIAATFPAFLQPELFPMVDTRVAKWVGDNMKKHNDSNAKAPQLVRPRYLDTKSTVLTLSDFEFVHSWSRWCRHKANQLTEITSINWRPRDVEMAIFNAWGDRGKKHPDIQLEILN